ncbi:MAG: hypothetical protein MK041_04075, partial [Aquabacterium sp.]|nr:hypothetical protein [Aquabacterium sp.]
MINARTAASAISSPLTSALNNPPSAAAGTATGLDRIDRTLSAGSARASFAVMLERQATGATPAQATPTPQ